MNPFMNLKTGLLACVLASSVLLSGCQADGDGTVGPGNGVGGGGSVDGTGQCVVPAGDICVSGGSGTTTALLDELLAPNGPLSALAGPLGEAGVTEDLETAVQDLLVNDGDLANLVENLLLGTNGKDPNLQLAAAALLDGGLQDILTGLLSPQTLTDTLGPEGVAGLLQALLLDGTDANCQAPLGTICLIGGNGGKTGLVEALITDNGNLTPLADGNLSEQDLVAVLGDLLESNGSLADLVSGLFQDGQLIEGLRVLLDPNEAGSVADALGDLLLDQGRDQNLVTALLDGLGQLLGGST